MKKKFKDLLFVKTSLIFLYLAFTIPIPFISNDQLKILSIAAFVFGLFLIIDITNDLVETNDKKISFKTSFFCEILGKKSWEISWKDIISIESFPTSQGSKVHYFVTNKNERFLVPQRIENFEEFILIISKRTNINTLDISHLSPLWTYKLLTYLSLLMIIGEIIAYTI